MDNLNHITTDEITLFSYQDPSLVVLNQIDIEIKQSDKMRGIYRKITIFDGSYCQQSVQIKHQKKVNFRIDLAYLNPLPVREHHIAWNWVYSASGLALLSFVMLLAGWYTGWIVSSIFILPLP